MKVLLLNGPPGSGKDTIGKMLWESLANSCVEKFAQPIVDFMHKNFDIRMESVEKDHPHPNLLGRTPRQVAIRYSEGFAKPLWGHDVFGKHAVEQVVQRTRERQKVAIFTDSGFLAEAVPVLAHVGKGNILQIRLARRGCSYHGDSRSTWDHPSIGFVDFENDCPNLKELKHKVHSDLVPEIEKWLTL